MRRSRKQDSDEAIRRADSRQEELDLDREAQIHEDEDDLRERVENYRVERGVELPETGFDVPNGETGISRRDAPAQ